MEGIGNPPATPQRIHNDAHPTIAITPLPHIPISSPPLPFTSQRPGIDLTTSWLCHVLVTVWFRYMVVASRPFGFEPDWE